MKIILIPCFYSIKGSVANFSINCWYVGKYLLSYTVQECAEIYCELVGWKLLHLYKEDGVGNYSMWIEMPDDEDVVDTIYDGTDLGVF